MVIIIDDTTYDYEIPSEIKFENVSQCAILLNIAKRRNRFMNPYYIYVLRTPQHI